MAANSGRWSDSVGYSAGLKGTRTSKTNALSRCARMSVMYLVVPFTSRPSQ
jgi:hypothetical protein